MLSHIKTEKLFKNKVIIDVIVMKRGRAYSPLDSFNKTTEFRLFNAAEGLF